MGQAVTTLSTVRPGRDSVYDLSRLTWPTGPCRCSGGRPQWPRLQVCVPDGHIERSSTARAPLRTRCGPANPAGTAARHDEKLDKSLADDEPTTVDLHVGRLRRRNEALANATYSGLRNSALLGSGRSSRGRVTRTVYMPYMALRAWFRHASSLTSGFRPGLAKCDLLIRKSAFDLGGSGLSRVLSATSRRHFPVKSNARSTRVAVSPDGKGLVSQAGAVLLWETMRVTGLGRGLSQGLSRWRSPRAVHDPGKIVADLAAAVALGGDCLADIAVLREQPELAGPVASDPVVSRLVSTLAGDLPRALKAIRSARAAARERAWALAGDAAPGADGGLVTVDLDGHHRDRPFRETESRCYVEEDVRLPSRHRLRRPRRQRERGAPRDHAAGRAAPGPTRPPTTSRRPGWRWPSCPAACAAGSWSAPTPAAAPTGSWTG